MNAVVHSLNSDHRAEVERHVQQLPAEDRALAAPIDFERDVVFGLFERDHALAGVAHLSLAGQSGSARLGVSVAPKRRGRGYGYALLSVAGSHAARRGLSRLFMHRLAENRALVHLARKAGMTVVRRSHAVDTHIALQPCPDEHPAQRRRSMLDWFSILQLGAS